MQTYSFTISPEESGQRLDRFLGEHIDQISREKIKRAIQEGQCTLAGLPVTSPGAKLRVGQVVELRMTPPARHVQPEEGDITPLWHDEHLLIINKPAGITVHPCPSCPEGTLVQRLATHFPQLMEQEGQRPGIVHRLDKDTSGLLAVALTEEARLRLAADFAERQVHKEYLALVRGIAPEQGAVYEPMGRHPLVRIKMAVVPESKGGRPAHSEWQRLYADPGGRFSLLAVRIHTGRTHQIRVHMAHVGHPLWGDNLYGLSAPAGAAGLSSKGGRCGHDPAPRQMLHAWKLQLQHPVLGDQRQFFCLPPEDILETAKALSRHMRRVVLTGLPGCGKSALLKLLEKEGLPVWSADAVVAFLYTPGGAGHDFLRTRFGTRFVPEIKEAVDRAALREAMTADPFLRQEVECAMHGLVRHSLTLFWEKCEKEGHTHAVAEVPLYLEKGWTEEGIPPLLVGVHCPGTMRHQRLIANRQWSEERCAIVDSWQWSEERKMAACQHVVNNDGTPEQLTQAATQLVHKLMEDGKEEELLLTKSLRKAWGEG